METGAITRCQREEYWSDRVGAFPDRCRRVKDVTGNIRRNNVSFISNCIGTLA